MASLPSVSLFASGAPIDMLTPALGLPEPGHVFPWQQALLAEMLRGHLPSSVDIPTGLGKTSVIAIWLVARALGAPVPRRLIYVVDRRAVVDQATAEAERLRAWVHHSPTIAAALGLAHRKLPISTLRGQFVDNREWLEDPSLPAIIVGTVDMIGSRLLFEGYGASRKIRPYHAALLATDSFIVVDEAHLIPAFEALIASIHADSTLHAPELPPGADYPPRLRPLSLSATRRSSSNPTFTLSSADMAHPVVAQRVNAEKHLRILPPSSAGRLADDLANAAWALHEELRAPVACIVFCDSRDIAKTVANQIAKLAKSKVDVELFVGARRVAERELAEKSLRELGFVAGDPRTADKSRFLVATSAAEVGVDLDAEHMVCDVVAWERMVQRLGRVNRRGRACAQVRVVATPPDTLKKFLNDDESETNQSPGAAAAAERYRSTLDLLQRLPRIESGVHDASPAALRKIAADGPELVQAATTPAPLRPALDRATLDAWAMTSLPAHPGRPNVAPWLRGWVEEEAQTVLIWRRFLPAPPKNAWSPAQQAAFFEAASPHASEMLEVETRRVLSWLDDRVAHLVELAKASDRTGLALQTPVAATLNHAGECLRTFTLADLVIDEKLGEKLGMDRRAARRNAQALERDHLPHSILVIEARFGGLAQGLLDSTCNDVPPTADGDAPWLVAGAAEMPAIRFRLALRPGDAPPTTDENWRERLRLPWEKNGDGEVSTWLVIEKWRHDAATEEDRSAGRPQLLAEHQAWTEKRAEALGQRLGLSAKAIHLLRLAARLHDEGKRAPRWQQAMRAPKDGIYAKTRGPVATALLDGYRHELGSLTYVSADPDFQRLSPEEQDLVLHLVAAHHGYARPLISTSGVDDFPPSVLQNLAQQIALRYLRLAERWGPWGLAWWESLLRAADQQASRDNDAGAR